MSRIINVSEVITTFAGDEISQTQIGTITVDENNFVTDSTVQDKLPSIGLGQLIESEELFITTVQEEREWVHY